MFELGGVYRIKPEYQNYSDIEDGTIWYHCKLIHNGIVFFTELTGVFDRTLTVNLNSSHIFDKVGQR